MKILHTADWHLGKRLDAFSRFDEQVEVMAELCDLAEREAVDAVIVAGDLYDSFNPPNNAAELLYKTLRRLSDGGRRAVVAIAGNHDQPERIEAPDPLARACGIVFAGFPHTKIECCRVSEGVEVLRSDAGFVELKLPGRAVPLRLLLTPYANELRLKTFLGTDDPEASLRDVLRAHWQRLADAYCDDRGVNLLAAHLYLMREGDDTPPEEPDDEKPILHVGGAQVVFTSAIPPQIQYAALGHLHRYQVVDTQPCPVVYSSSPLAYSFSEANQTKYAVIVEAEPGQPVKFRNVELTKGKRLVRNRFEVMDEALDWLGHHADCYVQVTMVTPTYLEAADKKRLLDAHPALMPIVPEIRPAEETPEDAAPNGVDLTKGMEALFADYFRQHRTVNKTGQEAPESLLSLFREVLALDDEE